MQPFPKFLVLVVLAGLVLTGCAAPSAPVSPVPTAASPVDHLHWFGTSSVLYHGSVNIYFDPVDVEGNPPTADLVLISNGQNAYCNIDSLKKIVGPDTTLLISSNATGFFANYQGDLAAQPVVMQVGQKQSVDGATVEAVNLQNNGGHHPIQDGLGYLVSVDGIRLYYSGPTVFFPEMSALQSDLAIYPALDRADVEKAAAVLPAKTIILVNTSATFSQILAQTLSKTYPATQFVALEPGPFTP